MRIDEPSLTARGVALARSVLERPSTPTGDPEADNRLTAGLIEGYARPERSEAGGERVTDFLVHMAMRTRFFDDAVLAAVAGGLRQIVILGAGYDGRALRFRSPGVRFFEVDHPATQDDKRRRLAQIDARVDDIVFVPADFTQPGLAAALDDAGHRSDRASLFVCEGVLRYLPETWFRELLTVIAARASNHSRLAVSISTDDGESDEEVLARRRLHEQQLADAGEPVLTVPTRDVALAWLREAGWSPLQIEAADRMSPPDAPSGTNPIGRRRGGRLLILAEPASR